MNQPAHPDLHSWGAVTHKVDGEEHHMMFHTNPNPTPHEVNIAMLSKMIDIDLTEPMSMHAPPSSPADNSGGHFDFTGAQSHNVARIDLMDRGGGNMQRTNSTMSFNGSNEHTVRPKRGKKRDDPSHLAAAKASTWVRKVHRAKKEFLAKSHAMLSDVAIGTSPPSQTPLTQCPPFPHRPDLRPSPRS
jgi:hypothetical protein